MMYNVTWEIDVDADTPQLAALRALKYQRAQDSTATLFTVHDSNNKVTTVDLCSVKLCQLCADVVEHKYLRTHLAAHGVSVLQMSEQDVDESYYPMDINAIDLDAFLG